MKNKAIQFANEAVLRKTVYLQHTPQHRRLYVCSGVLLYGKFDLDQP
jgi:hypothetical protein